MSTLHRRSYISYISDTHLLPYSAKNNSIMIQLLAAAMARIHKILTEMHRRCLEKASTSLDGPKTPG